MPVIKVVTDPAVFVAYDHHAAVEIEIRGSAGAATASLSKDDARRLAMALLTAAAAHADSTK